MFPFRFCPILSALKQNRNFINPFRGLGKHQPRYQRAGKIVPVSAVYEKYDKDGQQSIRCYASQAIALETRCWNCKATMKPTSHMLCAKCGHLQDVVDEMNYFDLFECPRNFDLEPQQLTRQFRQLQTIVHPDKFSNKSEREQTNSADWSSFINKAYKTLSTPIERGQYLLQLNGLQIPEDNSTLDKEFLMEMMERNEEIEEAKTEDELRKLDERIVNEMNEKAAELIIQFNRDKLKEAMGTLVQMKYLRSMQRTIKTKLQATIF